MVFTQSRHATCIIKFLSILFCIKKYLEPCIRILFAITILTLLFSNSIIVYANAGPPHLVFDGDVEFLLPIKRSDVEIKSEQLLYKLNDFIDETMCADITAKYEMCNTSVESVDVLIAFVTNNMTCPLEILFRGESVKIIRKKELNSPQKISRDWSSFDDWKRFGVWEPTFKEIMFYFSTGKISDGFNSSWNYNLEVTLFKINFKPNEVCELVVSYTEQAAYIVDRGMYCCFSGYSSDRRFQFYYLLEPAQYWKDFKNLTITIVMPKKLKTKFSLDGFTFDKKNNAYTAHFDNLPDKNLEILVYK